MKAEIREKRLLLKVDCHFNRTESASSSKNMQGVNAMRDITKKLRLFRTRLSCAWAEFKVIEQDDHELKVNSSQEAAKIDGNSTANRR